MLQWSCAANFVEETDVGSDMQGGAKVKVVESMWLSQATAVKYLHDCLHDTKVNYSISSGSMAVWCAQ